MSRRVESNIVETDYVNGTVRGAGSGVESHYEFVSLDISSPAAAWLRFAQKLTEMPLTLDLDRVGLDAHALASVSPRVATDLRVVPVRLIQGVLIVAASHETYNRACRELQERIPHLTCRVAMANPVDVAQSLEICYSPDM